MNSAGLLEYHFGHILSNLRELHAMFPAHVDVTCQKVLADKAKLLGMFHAIGHNAERTDWYQPASRHENPHKKFEGFHPSRQSISATWQMREVSENPLPCSCLSGDFFFVPFWQSFYSAFEDFVFELLP